MEGTHCTNGPKHTGVPPVFATYNLKHNPPNEITVVIPFLFLFILTLFYLFSLLDPSCCQQTSTEGQLHIWWLQVSVCIWKCVCMYAWVLASVQNCSCQWQEMQTFVTLKFAFPCFLVFFFTREQINSSNKNMHSSVRQLGKTSSLINRL